MTVSLCHQQKITSQKYKLAETDFANWSWVLHIVCDPNVQYNPHESGIVCTVARSTSTSGSLHTAGHPTWPSYNFIENAKLRHSRTSTWRPLLHEWENNQQEASSTRIGTSQDLSAWNRMLCVALQSTVNSWHDGLVVGERTDAQLDFASRFRLWYALLTLIVVSVWLIWSLAQWWRRVPSKTPLNLTLVETYTHGKGTETDTATWKEADGYGGTQGQNEGQKGSVLLPSLQCASTLLPVCTL